MKTPFFSQWAVTRDISFLLGGIKRHTRMVGMTKTILGLLSLILILVVVLLPQHNSDNAGVRIAFTSVETTDKDQPRMIRPNFQGVDSKSQPYTVSAESATQLDNNVVELQKMNADIMMNGNKWMALTADKGTLQVSEKMLHLQGNVSIYQDGGYEIHGDGITVNLHESTANSDMPVMGQGPMGILNATGFFVAKDDGTLHFKGPVTLTLYPHAHE